MAPTARAAAGGASAGGCVLVADQSDAPDYYLVANPIDRYSIGDRTPGLHTADDGSATIFMQTDSPGPDKESNWLPTPERRFRPILRMYQPQKAILDGTYVLPAVRKVD